jgi:hypothetical protein
MRWIRANKAIGGRLALFALALQFYLSFGHIHPEDIYGPADVTLSGNKIIALPATEFVRPSPSGIASDDDGGLCAICATMYLLSTSFVPEAPLLPVPPSSRVAIRFDRIDAVFIAPQRSAFQSRAPPAA